MAATDAPKVTCGQNLSGVVDDDYSELLYDEGLEEGAAIAALAFGPGLTVESALLTRTAKGPV